MRDTAFYALPVYERCETNAKKWIFHHFFQILHHFLIHVSAGSWCIGFNFGSSWTRAGSCRSWEATRWGALSDTPPRHPHSEGPWPARGQPSTAPGHGAPPCGRRPSRKCPWTRAGSCRSCRQKCLIEAILDAEASRKNLWKIKKYIYNSEPKSSEFVRT